MKGLLVAGYGGHAGYAFAIASELAMYADLDILLPRGYEYLENKFTSLGNIRYLTLPRKPLEPFHQSIHRWFMSLIESLGLVKQNYTFVLSTGSNFSIMPSLTLKFIKGNPLFTLEDVNRFSKPAKAVRVLSRAGAMVFLHWEEQLHLYPEGIVVGPVHEPAFYEPGDEGYVLVTLGTLGSRDVFDTIVNMDFEMAVVQTGDVDYKPYVSKKPSWIFFKYTNDLHKWLSKASVIITHPGTTAVTARLAYGKPTVIVYTRRHAPLYPKSDVETLARKLNAHFIDRVDENTLTEAIEKAKKLSKPETGNGVKAIVDFILRFHGK
ncbi:MAG: glycosyltransferase [Desulfurococcaceae archaeon]